MSQSNQPYFGIGKYQPMERMTLEQISYWNDLDIKVRLEIRNGTAIGMTEDQLRNQY